jgi:DNA-binding response OmpR family regulator
MRVLVVEDESDIAGLVKHTLERSGDARVEIASSGDQALKLASEQTPDLIILDLNLPGARRPRSVSIASYPPWHGQNTDHHADRADHRERSRGGAGCGADDYVTKPFSPRELAARVRAGDAARPADDAGPPPIYRGEHLVADFDAVSIAVDGQQIKLTRREFELLKYLVENRNRVLSRDRPARASVGLRSPDRDAIGRRARRPAARQARRRGQADRNRSGSRLPIHRDRQTSSE